MVATGQEMVREKKIIQGQGKVREFHFESRKSEILRVLIYLLPTRRYFCVNKNARLEAITRTHL